MKIVLFGGSGILGTEMQKHYDLNYPSRAEVNITNMSDILIYLKSIRPDVVINGAAVTDNRIVEKNPISAIDTNIIGSANLAIACLSLNIRYVYISTDYVYPGDHGNYQESDPIMPFNLYSWTKLGGECSAVAVKNHLIIRTSFGANTFPYKEAFTDKWTSKDYVDQIAPLIYEASISPLTGVLNLGTERKTLYDHASERTEVSPVKISDTNFATPYDTSLNLQRWQNYKADKSIAKPHTNCRVCGSDKLVKYLDLGLMPLANNLESKAVDAKSKERFPLQVMFCTDCSLSQLSVVIDPEKMFSYYTYRSSVNKPYVDHCRQMANDLRLYEIDENSFHIDIAGNDGTLLKEFKSVHNHKVLNIDPASNLTAISEANGIPAISDFWSQDVAIDVVNTYGNADLITATNVFAHLDDVKGFLQACEYTLSYNGILVIENPYLIDFIENMEFDTVYFEHVTYWSLTPLVELCKHVGLTVIDVQKQDIHGGTMRYIIAKDESYKQSEQVSSLLISEIEYTYLSKYTDWSAKVYDLVGNFSAQLLALKKSGKKIAAFAASAKGNTLLNMAGMNTDIIDFIADDTPEKIGKFSPGTGIPIVGIGEVKKHEPDYIVILSWNFTDAIIERLRPIYKGKFIVPIPEFKIIE
ncbi:MAG: sugar nucleotide-binding protein [Pedobacter sp.]|jgi:dTDP-4-dehydrorhamnose reductase